MIKKRLLPVFVFFTVSASAQCTDLFFSEYLEGSSNNKAIEIYNPTSAPINLTGYVIYRANNGSPTAQDSLFPQDILAPGDVWIAGNPSGDPAILAQSDTLHTITFFNGDDCLWIKKISTGVTLDVIGQLGVDPGTNWVVGSGATSEFTLVRMIGIQQGNTNWAVAATEYDVQPQNTFSFLGSHSMTSCCTAPTVVFQSQVNIGCFGGTTGSINVTANGNGPFTYAWTNRPETTSTLSGIPAGTYTVTVTGACGTDSMTFTLTEPTAVNAQINSQVNPTCFGSTDGSVSVVVTGGTPGYTYLWSSGGTNAVENGLGDGSYLVTVTDANGCTGIAGATITEPTVLTPSLTASTPSGCTTADGSLTVTASGGTPGYTYLWSNGATTATASNLGFGAYTCTVTCANGCVSVGGPYNVLNTTPPTVTVTLNIDTACTSSVSIVLSGGSPSGGTYSGIDVTGDSTFVPDTVGYSVVTYTYVDLNGCSASAIDSIWVDDCLRIFDVTPNDFLMYPNPFTDVVTLNLNGVDHVVSVYNMQGKLVYSENLIGNVVRISLDQLPVGVYAIQVVNENGMATKKIQKTE
jgi:hypothetical protein